MGDVYSWSRRVLPFGLSRLKVFRFFNLLLIDLRGHGKSKHHMLDLSNSITFDAIAEEIIEVLDHEKVASSHFMGISLGTVLIRSLPVT